MKRNVTRSDKCLGEKSRVQREKIGPRDFVEKIVAYVTVSFCKREKQGSEKKKKKKNETTGVESRRERLQRSSRLIRLAAALMESACSITMRLRNSSSVLALVPKLIAAGCLLHQHRVLS